MMTTVPPPDQPLSEDFDLTALSSRDLALMIRSHGLDFVVDEYADHDAINTPADELHARAPWIGALHHAFRISLEVDNAAVDPMNPTRGPQSEALRAEYEAWVQAWVTEHAEPYRVEIPDDWPGGPMPLIQRALTHAGAALRNTRRAEREARDHAAAVVRATVGPAAGYGVTESAAGAWVGVSRNTIRAWLSETGAAPTATDTTEPQP